MTDTHARHSTHNSKFIRAAPEAVYRAFTDPEALAVWMAPGSMTGKMHNFDGRVGGGYEMSLYYPDSDSSARGKTTAKEDRSWSRFVELTPPSRIVQAVRFDSDDPAFAGEMRMEVTLAAEGDGTNVSILFNDIPPGIRPADNEKGTQSSLDKLARYLEQDESKP